MRKSSQRLAASALQRAREQIGEIGERRAWDRWRDDPIVWRLTDRPGASVPALFLAGHLLTYPQREGDHPQGAVWLAAQYLVGALLLAMIRHGHPPGPDRAWPQTGLPMANGRGEGDAGRRNGGGPGASGGPLARALAALDEACGQARSRPALLRELRRLHHCLALVRGAVVQGDQAAIRRDRRDGRLQAG